MGGIGEVYGGTSLLGPSSKVTVAVLPTVTVVEMVRYEPASQGRPFLQARYVLHTSGAVYMRQGSSSAVSGGLSSSSFVLEDNVYWPLDVDLESHRFLAIAGVDGEADVRMTLISGTDVGPGNAFIPRTVP